MACNEWNRGRVVLSKAGHDKTGVFVILATEGASAYICDGKRRRLESPKRKNVKHLAATAVCVPEESLATNREIRRALANALPCDA